MSSPRNWREMPQRYRLEAAKCKVCGKIFFPPRLICSACQAREFEKIKLSREGKLITYTVIRVGPSQFVDQVPYAIGIVELKEGVKVLTQITDCELDKLSTGIKVKLEFRKIQEDGAAGIICYGYKCVPA
ncbi:MAG: transcriptional regulator [Candidatus Fischerbacteria bacterium RBG_13_37_8]|uniref:Transcriptional regulator n=1 Tax=Candidatus Fischerbacteria bacterium RBG_13_37_8 TaxID=1817863 RepID=A0A1F5VUL4_9BACT|nr:MAG: transcriptional regulator [Candidatus Fischerbacteria bacterium RBG_13_37_8]